MNTNPKISVQICYLNNAKKIYKDEGLTYATENSVGFDLRACIEQPMLSIEPSMRISIPTGISIAPTTKNIAGFLYSRSGLGAIQGLTVAQGVGVIDPDYRGEIIAVLLNTSQKTCTVHLGDRIAQLVFQPAFQVQLEEQDFLETTTRGSLGFGHTGLH